MHLGLKLLDRYFSIIIDIKFFKKVYHFLSSYGRVDDFYELLKAFEAELGPFIKAHFAHEFSEFQIFHIDPEPNVWHDHF